MGPDPYRDWLAIKTDHETPNHYELLGIAPFTGDPAAVRQAYEDRYALVRRYEVGNYGDRASALMAELSDAFKCLTNEHQKSQYDRELYEALAARETRTEAGVPHETLVEQFSELEQIVDSEWQDQDPLGGATAPNSEDLAGLPVSASSSYLSSPAVGPPMEEAGKSALAIPVWLAALCTCGAGLFVIGAIVVAVNVLGSRDDQDSIAQAPAAPKSAVARADDSQPVPESSVSADAGNASDKVEWSGSLARVLVDEGGTLHLLVASSDRLFEAISEDSDLIQQLADYVCLAEDAELADDVKVAGAVTYDNKSVFDLEQQLQDAEEVPVVNLQRLDMVDNARSGRTELTSEEKQTLLSLRSVGHYTQFVATVSGSIRSTSREFQISFCGREFYVEIPTAWQALGAMVRQGQQITLVSRTTDHYFSPTGVVGINDRLLLEVETFNQPSFQQVVQSPAQFIDQRLIYQANLRSTMLKDNAATLSLDIQNAGQHFPLKGFAGIDSGQASFLEKVNGRDPFLVELKVARAGSPMKYRIISLTELNDPTNRVVFDAVAASKPEPMPLAESSVAQPGAATKVALSGLPDYVDLPPVSSQASEPLTPIADLAELEIEFASDLIALEESYGFVAKKLGDSQTPRWEIYLQKTLDVGTQEALVAHFAVDDGHLAFRWTDNASKLPAGQLRNCLMQLKSGDQSHEIALRSPLRSGATRLPSEEDKFQIAFDLEDPPSSESLRLDVDLSYGGSKVELPNRTNTSTRGRRLDFKVDAARDVEVQIALLSHGDKLTLQALPRYELTTNRQLTLSTEGVDDHERRIRQAGVKAERSLAKAQNMLQTARSALSRARDSATRAKFGAIVQTQNKAIAVNQKNLVELQRTLNSVDGLRSLVSQVRSNTFIRYRVSAEADETRLLLVDGEYSDEEAVRQEASSELPNEDAGVEGTWRLIRFETRGRQIGRSEGMRLRLENGQYSSQFGSLGAQGSYQIDASTTPPSITFDDADNPTLRQAGILQESGAFKLTSNATELWIAFSPDGSQPRDFTSTELNRMVVSVYRREE